MHRRMSLNYSMLDAVKENDMDLVKELLNCEATEVNFRDECGYTALHWAVMYGKSEIVHLLLSNSSCNVDLRAPNGYTGLHLAVKHGFNNIIQLLINYGAEINLKTKGERTAEDLAVTYNRWDVVLLLQKTRENKAALKYKKPSKWSLGKMLGCGAFGQVYHGKDLDTGKDLAVKCIHSKGQRLSAIDKHVEDLNHEICVLQNLTHENILQYYGYEKSESTMYIFMEYMQGGNMHDLAELTGGLEEEKLRMYTKQILDGVEYLHTHMVIHRDIKGGNILLDSTLMNIKLADFGLSKKIERCSIMSNLHTVIGSPYWMAPEVIKATATRISYGRKADIWSLGCTVVEMLTTKPPFSHLEPMTAIYNIGSGRKTPKIPDNISSTLKDFLRQCFKRDARCRPSSSDLLNHPFVKMDKKSSSSSDSELVNGESKVDFAVNLVSRQLRGIFGQASKFTKSTSESCVFKQMN